jgi:chitin disaccharide deacetylase
MTMKNILVAILLLMVFPGFAQLTLQERLGYAKDAKLLIIHADDLGVSHSENEASIYAMEKGSVSSGSIMVPCPWFPEIAAYARAHPMADLGLHLTLTSEWKYLKWGSVFNKEKVTGLLNNNGYFFESVDSLLQKGKPPEVEKEIRAQLERAKAFGIDFTHLDSHMGALYANADYLKIMIKLGREYKVPVMLMRPAQPSPATVSLDRVIGAKDVVLDMIYIANPPDYKNGMDNYYTGVLKSVQAGVSIILLHAAYDEKEMQAVTIDHPDYGAAWRQADFNFFTSEKCKNMLKEQQIHLITWREIRDKLLRQ